MSGPPPYRSPTKEVQPTPKGPADFGMPQELADQVSRHLAEHGPGDDQSPDNEPSMEDPNV